MDVRILKMKNFIMKKYTVIISILFVLCIFSSIWGALTYPQPTYKNESFILSHYTQYGEYSYFAQVTEPNLIYSTGSILNEQFPAYFYKISPNAIINFSYGFIVSDSAEMEVNVKTKIITSAKSRKEGEASFWTKTYSTESYDTVTLLNNQTYNHNHMLYAQDIQKVIDDIKKQLKYSQIASAKIVTSVTSKGTINGENVEFHEEYVLPVTIESSYYQLPGKVKIEETVNAYDSREVLVLPTTLDKITPFVLPLILLILTTIFYIYNHYYYVETDQQVINYLQNEKERADLYDWISEGKLPPDYKTIPLIQINSLVDIVNLSIDTSSRVIHDTNENIYFCMSHNVMYLFCQAEAQMSIN